MANFLHLRADNLDSLGLIPTIIIVIRDLMVLFILTKFSTDWLIFLDPRV